MDTSVREFDVVVVGGGVAGLAGALTLARARRSVLVVDEGRPRNAPARGVHGLLGSEGVSPAELLERGRAEVASYGGRVLRGRVESVERGGSGFTVVCADGTVVGARRLLVTTGVVDELPDIPGVAEHWGSGVLHCPYCHGWEVRDQPVAVVADGPVAVHAGLLWRQWTDRVTVFADPGRDLGEQGREKLAARGVTVVAEPVAAVEADDDGVSGVRTADGVVRAVRAVVVPTFTRSRSGLLADLGVPERDLRMGELVMGTHVEADAIGATPVPGVWAAGNVVVPHEQVVNAAAAGNRAGAAINADLVMEEAGAAVERAL
ncbi:NAD(P)/FAD-dependent oxidoreductase [Nocardiopsis sp. NPDC006938]|uniref:NAD(P)/FAD-dependent oxidoreductase n=1 Tax=Nocardiopsis sp. NPDC006938 TaxID=3364337 RepID=UPI0036CC2139